MKKQQQAAPQYTTDADGRQLAHIALANTDQRATLYADDYERWLAAGFSSFWSLTSTGGKFLYVLAMARSPSNSSRSLTVARWIAGAGKGRRVSYADGDRLNLRTENLVIVHGPAKAAARWLKANDGTPPRRKTKPDGNGCPSRPMKTLPPPILPSDLAPAYPGSSMQARPYRSSSNIGAEDSIGAFSGIGPSATFMGFAVNTQHAGKLCLDGLREAANLQHPNEDNLPVESRQSNSIRHG